MDAEEKQREETGKGGRTERVLNGPAVCVLPRPVSLLSQQWALKREARVVCIICVISEGSTPSLHSHLHVEGGAWCECVALEEPLHVLRLDVIWSTDHDQLGGGRGEGREHGEGSSRGGEWEGAEVVRGKIAGESRGG